MAQPHYRISQTELILENVSFFSCTAIIQSTIKSATISIHFITISKCASSPPTTTSSPSSSSANIVLGSLYNLIESLNWGDIQFIIHSFLCNINIQEVPTAAFLILQTFSSFSLHTRRTRWSSSIAMKTFQWPNLTAPHFKQFLVVLTISPPNTLMYRLLQI